jgi:phosphoglycolate phosphatase
MAEEKQYNLPIEVKPMYKTVFFDFDGTVFDTGPGVMNSVAYAAEAFGYPPADEATLRSFVGPPLKEQFMRVFGADEPTALAMVDKYRERYRGVGLTECAPYPGVAELAYALRAAGVNVAVATGKPTPFTKQILESHHMLDAFDTVLGSEFDGTRSQKWEVVAELLERYGGDGAVMVGDRDNDVLGAGKCAVPCIGVSWGYARPGELLSAGAICVVDNAEELKNILLG